MYKICKTEKSEARQKSFQTMLLEMMKGQKYEEISVTRLCKELGVPRKAFYRYYGTLDDVLHAILDDALTESFLHLEVKLDLTGFFRYWKENRELLDVLEKSKLTAALVKRINEQLRELIRTDVQLGTTDYFRYSAHVAAVMTLLLNWHQSGMEQSEEEMSNLVTDMFQMENVFGHLAL